MGYIAALPWPSCPVEGVETLVSFLIAIPVLSTFLFTPIGCVDFEESTSEGTALGFDGESSCATANVDAEQFGEEMTIEAFVQSSAEPLYGVHPLIIWAGAFALWESAEGTATFSEPTTESVGVTTPTGWMDGELHHVAATWDGSIASLYLDGQRKGFTTSVEIGDDVANTLYVGCWGDKGLHHEGIVDEVRISNSVLYENEFDIPTSELVEDDNTVFLWHMDEGTGETAFDTINTKPLSLENVGWVSFALDTVYTDSE